MDVRAERQDLREIAALVIDLDDKERKEPKDAGYKCARHLLEAQRGGNREWHNQSGLVDRLRRLDKAAQERRGAISRTDSHCP